MKASRAIFLLGGFSSGLAAALLVLVAVLGWETFSLRDRLAEAQQRHQTAAAELARLQAQQDQTESRLTEHRAQLETLRAELDARRDAQTTNAPAPPATRAVGRCPNTGSRGLFGRAGRRRGRVRAPGNGGRNRLQRGPALPGLALALDRGLVGGGGHQQHARPEEQPGGRKRSGQSASQS